MNSLSRSLQSSGKLARIRSGFFILWKWALFRGPLSWIAKLAEIAASPIRDAQMKIIFGDDFEARRQPCSVQKFASRGPLP